MLHNKLNIAFNLLPLKAFSLFGQGPVKGARCAALCGLPGIYMPLKWLNPLKSWTDFVKSNMDSNFRVL